MTSSQTVMIVVVQAIKWLRNLLEQLLLLKRFAMEE